MSLPNLQEFLSGPPKGSYIYHPDFYILYMWHGPMKILDIDYDNVVCIPNIKSRNCGAGAFKNLIYELSLYNIYIENVLTDRFENGLSRLGFIKVNNYRYPSYALFR